MNKTEIKDIFSKRLKEIRNKRGLLQKDMAEILTVSQSAYWRYENRKLLPKIKKIILIAKYFNVSVNYLLGLDDI